MTCATSLGATMCQLPTWTTETLVVAVERRVMHPKYKKYITRHTNLHAHDEKETAQVGDFVELVECRRMSKTKRFRLVSVLKKAGE